MGKFGVNNDLIITFNASGAARAAQLGYTVVIVDVIDMSTSLEAALQAGAAFVFGASPDITKAPVKVNPYKIGVFAGKQAKQLNSEVIIITEPRFGSEKDRLENCSLVRKGLKEADVNISDVIPNLGAELVKNTSFNGKVVICVSDTGGVAFDAAWQFHNRITTGTVARTFNSRGKESAIIAAKRAISIVNGNGIAVVAASSNSQEDILGANLIAQTIIDCGYLNI